MKRISEQNILTLKEQEVVYCLASGLSNKDIATRMKVSIHTVKAHLESIYEKLKVENRLQAVIRALQLNFININEIDIINVDTDKRYK